jgi:hypothetical protein
MSVIHAKKTRVQRLRNAIISNDAFFKANLYAKRGKSSENPSWIKELESIRQNTPPPPAADQPWTAADKAHDALLKDINKLQQYETGLNQLVANINEEDNEERLQLLEIRQRQWLEKLCLFLEKNSEHRAGIADLRKEIESKQKTLKHNPTELDPGLRARFVDLVFNNPFWFTPSRIFTAFRKNGWDSYTEEMTSFLNDFTIAEAPSKYIFRLPILVVMGILCIPYALLRGVFNANFAAGLLALVLLPFSGALNFISTGYNDAREAAKLKSERDIETAKLEGKDENELAKLKGEGEKQIRNAGMKAGALRFFGLFGVVFLVLAIAFPPGALAMGSIVAFLFSGFGAVGAVSAGITGATAAIVGLFPVFHTLAAAIIGLSTALLLPSVVAFTEKLFFAKWTFASADKADGALNGPPQNTTKDNRLNALDLESTAPAAAVTASMGASVASTPVPQPKEATADSAASSSTKEKSVIRSVASEQRLPGTYAQMPGAPELPDNAQLQPASGGSEPRAPNSQAAADDEHGDFFVGQRDIDLETDEEFVTTPKPATTKPVAPAPSAKKEQLPNTPRRPAAHPTVAPASTPLPPKSPGSSGPAG